MTFFYSELFSIGCLVIIGVFIIAGIVVTKRIWEPTPHMAPAYGLILAALAAWITTIAFFIAPTFGIVLSWVLFVASFCILRWFEWRRWGRVVLWSSAAIGAYVICLVAFGFLMGTNVDALSTMQVRFLNLPIDNSIPYLFSERLWHSTQEPFLVGDWHASDRPPLQSGFILLDRALLEPFIPGLNNQALPALAFGVGLTTQTLWLPAMYAALRSLRFSSRATLFGLATAAITPVIFINSLYTWPKLLSATLLVTAITICVEMLFVGGLSATKFIMAGTGVALSMLAHGASAFALPIFVGITLFLVLRRKKQLPFIRRIKALGAGLAVSLLLYAPWFVYQRFVDPPGDRLIKWHLAGLIPPSENLSLLEVFKRQFSQLDPEFWATSRVQNIDVIFGFTSLRNTFTSGGLSIDFLRNLDFFSLVPSLAISILLCLMLFVQFVAQPKKLIESYRSNQFRVRLGLFCLLSLSVVLWILMMFLPGSTLIHHGSHLWPLAIICVAFAIGFEKMPNVAFALFAIQAGYSIFLFTNQVDVGSAQIHPIAASIMVISAIFTSKSWTMLNDALHYVNFSNNSKSQKKSLGTF